MERLSWARQIELAGDASYRCYTRLVTTTGTSVIRVTYPPERAEALARDCEVLEWLSARGIRVPLRLQPYEEPGRLYLEDFGEKDAEQTLDHSAPDSRWLHARRLASPLAALAAISVEDLPPWNPPLGAERLREELAGFEKWFLERFVGTAPGSGVGDWLNKLAARIGRHPRRVCHRDYHLNNLFFLGGDEVGVIDAQDVLVGPDTYDAVSLVGERAFPCLMEEGEVRRWLDLWAETTDAASGWQHRVLETGVQRALKVLGTFARLDLNNKPQYRRWMEPLARRAAPVVRDLGAPPWLVGILLDFRLGGSHG